MKSGISLVLYQHLRQIVDGMHYQYGAPVSNVNIIVSLSKPPQVLIIKLLCHKYIDDDSSYY